MKAIRHIGITVKDLDQAIDFYQGILGFKVVKRMNEQGKFIDYLSGLKNVDVTTVKMAADDGNLIELLFYHSHPCLTDERKRLTEIGLSHIAFTVEDITEEYNKLKKAGVKFNSAPKVSPDKYAKVAFFRDPEGNFIELVEVL